MPLAPPELPLVRQLTALLYLLAGGCLCFAGYLTYLPLLLFVAMFTVAVTCMAIFAWLPVASSPTASVQLGLMGGALALGVVAALLVVRYRAAGALLAGGLAGFLLALRVAVVAAGMRLTDNADGSLVIGTTLVLALLAVAGAWLTYLLEPVVLVLATSLIGSVWCAVAVDQWARVGFNSAITEIVYGGTGRNNNGGGARMSGGTIGLLVMVALLTVACTIFQLYRWLVKGRGYRLIRLPGLRRWLCRSIRRRWPTHTI